MIFFTYDRSGGQHICDMTDIFYGTPAFLVGGAPSLKEQDPSLLERRGLLTFAINNTGKLFRPTAMISCDNPKCFDRRLLKDPTVMKFCWNTFAEEHIRDGDMLYREIPNVFMFDVMKHENDRRLLQIYRDIPWKRNSLFAGIVLMYHLGIRKMFLAGSDFGPNEKGEMYSAGASLDDKERVWNEMLYKSQVRDLIKLKPLFDENGLEIVDTSKNSKLSTAYRTSSLKDAVDECLVSFPGEFEDSLPHVSRLYPGMADKVVASRYSIVDEKDALKGDGL